MSEATDNKSKRVSKTSARYSTYEYRLIFAIQRSLKESCVSAIYGAFDALHIVVHVLKRLSDPPEILVEQP
jgi:hypothetical protein